VELHDISYSSCDMSAFRRKLTHLLILDFEATCGDGIRVQLNNQEIIEFPTILYNLSSRTVEGTFHEYIRPVRVPTLTTFCTELTGIEQVLYAGSLYRITMTDI
jgi:inhibitor of KinA sporulation pathway (predicted exonuclease)